MAPLYSSADFARGFRSEWYTTGRHRVYIQMRTGHPTTFERQVTRRLASSLKFVPTVQIVSVYHDDQNDCVTVTFASHYEQDMGPCSVAMSDLERSSPHGLFSGAFVRVPPVQLETESYDAAAHLSSACARDSGAALEERALSW